VAPPKTAVAPPLVWIDKCTKYAYAADKPSFSVAHQNICGGIF
jgi:hypothetical protein